jgi:hypothetical protein
MAEGRAGACRARARCCSAPAEAERVARGAACMRSISDIRAGAWGAQMEEKKRAKARKAAAKHAGPEAGEDGQRRGLLAKYDEAGAEEGLRIDEAGLASNAERAARQAQIRAKLAAGGGRSCPCWRLELARKRALQEACGRHNLLIKESSGSSGMSVGWPLQEAGGRLLREQWLLRHVCRLGGMLCPVPARSGGPGGRAAAGGLRRALGVLHAGRDERAVQAQGQEGVIPPGSACIWR